MGIRGCYSFKCDMPGCKKVVWMKQLTPDETQAEVHSRYVGNSGVGLCESCYILWERMFDHFRGDIDDEGAI